MQRASQHATLAALRSTSDTDRDVMLRRRSRDNTDQCCNISPRPSYTSTHNTPVLWFATRLDRTNKKAQLSLTNTRDAKACQKLLQFDVLTTLSLTILAYVHSFSCCCVRNLRNRAKFTENSNLWSSRSSKVIDLGVNRKPMYDFLVVVTNSNFGRICYRFRDIDA